MLKKIFIMLLITGSAYLVALPFLTAYALQTAGIRNDPSALARNVDFRTLKQNLKVHVNDVLRRQMGGEMEDNPFAPLVASLSSALIDPMIEQYVTPTAMVEVMKGHNPLQSDAKNREALDGEKNLLDGASMRYESIDRFIVTIGNGTSLDGLKLILLRRGWRWVLTEILLPV